LAALLVGSTFSGRLRGGPGEVAEFLAGEKPGVVAAMHCTGPLAQAVLREKLGEAYVLAGTGSRIELR